MARAGNAATMTQGWGLRDHALSAAMVLSLRPSALRSPSRSGGNSSIRGEGER